VSVISKCEMKERNIWCELNIVRKREKDRAECSDMKREDRYLNNLKSVILNGQ
jgi:hypothetical protein